MDSSIKRNTALTKKLSKITEETRASILDDLSKVNISKYVTEAVAATVEGKLRAADVPAALEIVSKLHRVYPDFAPRSREALPRFVCPDAKAHAPSATAALAAVRAAASGDAADTETPPRATTTKSRSSPRRISSGSYQARDPCTSASFHSPRRDTTGTRRRSRTVSSRSAPSRAFSGKNTWASRKTGRRRRTDDVFRRRDDVLRGGTLRHLRRCRFGSSRRGCGVSSHARAPGGVPCRAGGFPRARVRRARDGTSRASARWSAKNARALERAGAVSEAASAAFSAASKARDATMKALGTLSEALRLPMPTLPEEEEEKSRKTEGEVALQRGVDAGWDGSGAADDEESKIFYENLPDLRAMVPAALLSSAGANDGGSGDDSASASTSAKAEALLARLPTLVLKDAADTFSCDFCFAAGGAASRRRLVESLASVPRDETQRLPFYARVAATLAAVFPEEVGAPATAARLCTSLRRLAEHPPGTASRSSVARRTRGTSANSSSFVSSTRRSRSTRSRRSSRRFEASTWTPRRGAVGIVRPVSRQTPGHGGSRERHLGRVPSPQIRQKPRRAPDRTRGRGVPRVSPAGDARAAQDALSRP